MIDPRTIDLLSLPFVLFSQAKKLPDISCIYFCLLEDNTVVYVGESGSLRYRWINYHEKRAYCRRVGVTKLSWLEVPVPATRADKHAQRRYRLPIERRFIQYYQPLLNFTKDAIKK